MGKPKHSFQVAEARPNVDELEQEVLTYWEEQNVFERSLEQTKEGELFTFYDGPPYATGKPHYGHILQSAIKDTVLRYKTMQGYYVPRRVGWDCHGLPVETLVEKELGFKNKKDIEKFGIEKFNQQCRDTVFRYIDEFTATLKRMGRWADYDNAYATLDQDYMESEWWVFQQLWNQDLVYKDFRSTPYCIRCATPLSNFEVTSNYHDRTDQAVYVLLSVVNGPSTSSTSSEQASSGSNEKLWLLIWTTTPWTLPANVAVAYSPDDEITYVVAEHEGKNIIMASDRVAKVLGDEATVVRELAKDELAQLTYQPPHQGMAEAFGLSPDDIFRLVPGDHVTAEEGTGLVHMAPAFGEEDAQVAKNENLPVLRTVDTNGSFLPEALELAGQNIFDATDGIIADLKKRGLLLRQEQYTHSYPYCWRCDEPLIYYALDSWFIRVTEIKDQLLANNEQINWIPGHLKHGRFAKGIESAPDWAVSRSRFWSVPIPIWECDACEERVCVGSREELMEKSGVSEVADLHRPYVDELTWSCESCDGTMRRVEEVLDVWFDSGSMPYAQWHYPFDNKEFVENGFPADFIVEAIEMTRAWFYVLHVLATGLTRENLGLGKDTPAYENVIGSGLIFAEDGQKLSKKLKNYPDIEPTVAQYGADTLRFYLLASTSLGEPYRFSEKDLRQLHRNVFGTLWNVYSFFTRYAETHKWTPGAEPGSLKLLDQWILARTRKLQRDVVVAADQYQIDQAARAFIPFIDDLSNWYVRRSRARFQPAGEKDQADTEAALHTLYTVLVEACQVVAPFMPFVAEHMYRNLTSRESVHLERLPDEASAQTAVTSADENLIQAMEQARQVVREGLALRAHTSLKVRQPLAQLVVATVVEGLTDDHLGMIKDELNVKEVTVGELPAADSSYAVSAEDKAVPFPVALKTELTDELKREGAAREIIRHGQQLRRQAGYELNDRIVVSLSTESDFFRSVLEQEGESIKEALQADTLESTQPTDATAEVTVDEHTIQLGVKRV